MLCATASRATPSSRKGWGLRQQDKCNSATLLLFNLSVAPTVGARYNEYMRVISRRALREFWEKHADAQQALQAWYADAKRANWPSPMAIKREYRNASIVADDRVVFNIKGNRYRLVVAIQYQFGIVYIRFVGTHSEYDRIDVTSI